jgi:tetratricopeptide (TPR) repeat protein
MRAALYALLFTLALTGARAPAHAQERIKGELAIATDAGYLRLIFRLDEEVTAKVRVSGAIMVITFDKPVSIAVDRINASAPAYVSASRLDPDGKAIRIALARAVKVNSIPAAERLYVDIMPDNWAGVIPGLPQEVVDDLSRRTREAERQLKSQRMVAKQKQMQTVRVKVANQPTFVRYVFDVPDQVNAMPERSDGKLIINFDQQVKWDLADAKAALPSTLESIDTETDFGSASVTFTLNGTPHIRAFREEGSIVVDVGTGLVKPKAQMLEGAANIAATAPETVPAVEPPEAAPIKDATSKEVPALKDAPAAEQMAKPTWPASPPPLIDAAPPAPAKTAQNAPAPQAPPRLAAIPPEVAAPVAVAPVVAVPVVTAPAMTKLAEAPAMAAAPRPAPNPDAPVVAMVTRNGGGLKVELPFAAPTPSAVFRRADVLWMVFDSPAKIDVTALTADSADLIRSAEFTRGLDGEGIVRVRLARPLLASLSGDGPSWVVNIGENVVAPSRPLTVARTAAGKGRASIVIPFADPVRIHRMGDPGFGDQIMVVTALGPARGFIKSQDFVELRTLASTHGVVVQPIADDIAAELSTDKITIGRPSGLSISPTLLGAQQQVAPNFRGMTFDTQLWGFDRQAKFSERQAELIRLAASAPPTQRKPARFNLARFYLAQEMPAEAKAVLDVAMADDRNNSDDVTGSILRSIANVMLDRPEEALKELTAPGVGDQQEAPLWRAIAYARQGKWDEARKGFKNADGTLGALPVQLQRMAISQALRSAIEVRDFPGATRMVNELETIGVPPELEPSIAVLTGRLNEGIGRNEDALTSYRTASSSNDRRSAAQGRLRETLLLFGSGDMPRQDVIHQLETITTVWRGDETEVEGLKLLAHLYTEDGRYREAFHTMRTAMRAHPNSDLTRKIQDEAASTFDTLFLAGKGDALPPIEALGLFYDFRELTPVGSRGDEMIRRLADRLVSVDLLDQATELLQHQVDHRLKGAGRAQVATRLATIYLMNRKPDRALAALQNTRVSDLANELRDQRLLLEARAISDIGRHGLALELIANINSREAIRLRSDILWAAKRWRDAAEQIELLYGERWREFTPLNDGERVDILRAAIGYQLSEETLSLNRLREKYAAKMADGPDRRAFDVVSAPIGAAAAEFQDVAKRVSNADTLSAFLADMRKRYPENLPPPQPKDAPPLAEKPKAPISKIDAPEKAAQAAPKKPDVAASALPPKPPAGTPLKPDMTSTGSIKPRLPKAIEAQR